MTSLFLRLSVGDTDDFVRQTITLGSIVALMTGGFAITNLARGFFSPSIGPSYVLLVTSLFAELQGLLFVWLVPVLLLLVFSSVVIGARSSKSVSVILGILRQSGSSGGTLTKLVAVRLLLLSALSWLFGWAGGLVVTQVGFRFVAFATGVPFVIPSLTPSDLGLLAVLSFGAMLGGTTYASFMLGRRKEFREAQSFQ